MLPECEYRRICHLQSHPNCHHHAEREMCPVCQRWVWFEYYREWIQLKCPRIGFSVFPIKRNVIVWRLDWRVARGKCSQRGKQSLIFLSGIDNFLQRFWKMSGTIRAEQVIDHVNAQDLWIKVRYRKWSHLKLTSLPNKPNQDLICIEQVAVWLKLFRYYSVISTSFVSLSLLIYNLVMGFTLDTPFPQVFDKLLEMKN